jgi:hypothetical protein
VIQEAYHEMLVKYREELTRPLQEAMEFLRRVETQVNSLSISGRSLRILSSGKETNPCSHPRINPSILFACIHPVVAFLQVFVHDLLPRPISSFFFSFFHLPVPSIFTGCIVW